MSAVIAGIDGIPWITVRQNPQLARLTLEVIERLEKIDKILGIVSVDADDVRTVKAELRRCAQRR